MIEWFLGQEGFYIYLFLFLALVGGAFGAPIPEDLPLVVGGVLVNRGSANAQLLFLVCYTAIVIGDLIIFLIGRRFGPTLFSKPWVQKRMPPARIRKMKLDLEKRSLLMIFLARHLFYLRTITFLTCGAVKMRFQRFIVADMCAALVSVPIMLSLGYFAAEHFEKALQIFKQIEYALLVATLLLLAYFYYRYKSRQSEREKGKEEALEKPGAGA